MEHHADGPDVGHSGLIRFADQYLRRGVSVTAAERLAQLHLAVFPYHVVPGEPEVRQLNSVVLVHQQVFAFDVPGVGRYNGSTSVSQNK